MKVTDAQLREKAKEGLSADEIAGQLGVSRTTAFRRLKKLGLLRSQQRSQVVKAVEVQTERKALNILAELITAIDKLNAIISANESEDSEVVTLLREIRDGQRQPPASPEDSSLTKKLVRALALLETGRVNRGRLTVEALREARCTLETLTQLHHDLLIIQDHRRFIRFMIDTVGEADLPTKERIVKKLRESEPEWHRIVEEGRAAICTFLAESGNGT